MGISMSGERVHQLRPLPKLYPRTSRCGLSSGQQHEHRLNLLGWRPDGRVYGQYQTAAYNTSHQHLPGRCHPTSTAMET